MSSISTRRGDGGETDLMFGRRVGKDHPRVAACGAVDELNAALGLARVSAGGELGAFIAEVQADLIVLMGELATLPEDLGRYVEKGFERFGDGRLAKLDALVERVEAAGLTFEGWALPGAAGDSCAAQLDLARTVCRRAERSIAPLGEEVDAGISRYLNRLSDALWLSAREREGEVAREGAS